MDLAQQQYFTQLSILNQKATIDWNLNIQASELRTKEEHVKYDIQKREAITNMSWENIFRMLEGKIGLFFLTSCECEDKEQNKWWNKKVFPKLENDIYRIIQQFYNDHIFFTKGVIKEAADLNMKLNSISEIIFSATSASKESPGFPVAIIQFDVRNDPDNFDKNDETCFNINLLRRFADGYRLQYISPEYYVSSGELKNSAKLIMNIFQEIILRIIEGLNQDLPTNRLTYDEMKNFINGYAIHNIKLLNQPSAPSSND